MRSRLLALLTAAAALGTLTGCPGSTKPGVYKDLDRPTGGSTPSTPATGR